MPITVCSNDGTTLYLQLKEKGTGMKAIWVGIMMFCAISTSAQTKMKDASPKAKKTAQAQKSTKASSSKKKSFHSSKPVYFPDYYAFYDPARGYVFWNETTHTWNESQQPPKFMMNIDMSKTRIQLIEGLHLDLRPEQNYPNYMKLYPARENDPKIPVPNSTTTHPR
ncbi:MAG TPA: hypothetical protein PL009_08395 [Flavipsychrobacter sp.]|nr:hypothetical protein [Flavipsychrobacter sp.]